MHHDSVHLKSIKLFSCDDFKNLTLHNLEINLYAIKNFIEN